MSTRVECHVDPVCPFAWATSRWLTHVDHSADRPVRTIWRQMSLAVLNEGHDPQAPHAQRFADSLRIGRVFAVAHSDEAVYETDGIGDLYLALGRRIHSDGLPPTTETIAAALTECGLDPALADAADDPLLDELVRLRHEVGQDAIGEKTGSPITVFDGHAMFGPVLTEIPVGPAADALFSAVVTAASTPGFALLQRPHSGPPNLTEPDPIEHGGA